jgi:diguanylate cyclase (GGDEF)-like protein
MPSTLSSGRSGFAATGAPGGEAGVRGWTWLLGRERVMRARLVRVLLAALASAACCGMVLVWAWLGHAPLVPAAATLAYMAAGVLLFYGLIRSGWSARRPDPAMVVEQMLHAIFGVLWIYSFLGEQRALVLPFIPLALSFAMFELEPRQTLRVGVVAVVLLALAAFGLAWAWPSEFTWDEQAFQFAMTAVVLLAMSVLGKQVSELRDRLRGQRQLLKGALAEVERMATHDELTGLINRRHMRNLLDAHLAERALGGQPLVVAMLDLDHFKDINDRHGHAAGDRVLQRFARAAQDRRRASDVPARWGGEEFLLVFPDTTIDEARHMVDDLRDHLAQTADDEQGLPVTFSAGLAEHAEGESGESLIRRADQALYEAKNAGRSRTVVAAAAA